MAAPTSSVLVAPPGARSWYSAGWHTFAWSTAYKPQDTTNVTWTTFTVAADPDPNSIRCTVTIKQAGAVTLKWGTRSAAYGSYSLPVQVPANTPTIIRITGLTRKKTYYVNAVANVTIPAATGGLPQPTSFQAGEASFALP